MHNLNIFEKGKHQSKLSSPVRDGLISTMFSIWYWFGHSTKEALCMTFMENFDGFDKTAWFIVRRIIILVHHGFSKRYIFMNS